MSERVGWSAGLLGVLLLGCASLSTPAKAEPLYFALEVRHLGEVVARPRLLGETGKTLRAERRQPGAPLADYQLVLKPMPLEGVGFDYRIDLQLTLKEGLGESRVQLGHGQERRVQLGSRPGELEVVLLVMRVDSPEFRALMNLEAAPVPPEKAPLAI